MPRFRFTVRRMMVAVAIVALVLGGWQMRKASERYQERAESHGSRASRIEDHAPIERGPIWVKIVAYHKSLAAKYEHAARYPWLPVAPDPPEPE